MKRSHFLDYFRLGPALNLEFFEADFSLPATDIAAKRRVDAELLHHDVAIFSVV